MRWGTSAAHTYNNNNINNNNNNSNNNKSQQKIGNNNRPIQPPIIPPFIACLETLLGNKAAKELGERRERALRRVRHGTEVGLKAFVDVLLAGGRPVLGHKGRVDLLCNLKCKCLGWGGGGIMSPQVE